MFNHLKLLDTFKMSLPFYHKQCVCSDFSTSSLTVVTVCPSDHSHPRGYEAVSHCAFDLHLLMTNDAEDFFMYLMAICIFSLENVYSNPALIFKLSNTYF